MMKTNDEYTGGSTTYYQVDITHPINTEAQPYTAECQDIIDALGMTFNEGNAFKALWRRCAARTLGKSKRGYTDGLYDAEKVVFYGERLVQLEQLQRKADGVGQGELSLPRSAPGSLAADPPPTPGQVFHHDGQGCPVADGTKVYFLRHSGHWSGPHAARVFPPGDWQWAKPGVYTIQAYQLA